MIPNNLYIGFLYQKESERSYISESEQVAKRFAKLFNGKYHLNGIGFWIITI